VMVEAARSPNPAPQPLPERVKQRWSIGQWTFRADFESANLARVEALPGSRPEPSPDGSATIVGPGEVQLWTAPDNAGTEHETGHRTWFYFGVSGGKEGDLLAMNVMNLNRQSKLYTNDFRPVFREHPSMSEWQRVRQPAQSRNVDGGDFRIRFKHRIESSSCQEILFAFCIPFSLTENAALISRVEARLAADARMRAEVYYHREVLALSRQGRPMDLITITAREGLTEETEAEVAGCYPAVEAEPPLGEVVEQGRARKAPASRAVFWVSARVHPGETPASHMLNGLLEFLLRADDPRAAALRRLFVFKLVPMLNPDGVALGHYRTDDLGQNLNRCYIEPEAEAQPTIFAAKALLLHFAAEDRLRFYIDLHAHANKRGCFAYGNALGQDNHVENLLYTKLAAINNAHFDFAASNFSEKNMRSKDKREDSTKEGSGRVALYQATGVTHIYTVESNYNTSRIMNIIAPATGEGAGRASPPSRARDPLKFDAAAFASMGRGLVLAALDLEESNPWSRLPNTDYKNLAGVRGWALSCMRSAESFRV